MHQNFACEKCEHIILFMQMAVQFVAMKQQMLLLEGIGILLRTVQNEI